ncbi:MAG TPA: glycosyltransferase, partial [Anaerolineales bacterium]|nr:glycosyltransferase [Anaerolineales bacterium]
MFYFILSTILFLLALIIIYWIHNQYHLDIVVTPVTAPTSAPKVSVCIPARNEETNIRRCVEAVLRQ